MQMVHQFGLTVWVGALCLCSVVEGASPETRQTIRVDESGVWTERTYGEGTGGIPSGGLRIPGVIWQLHDDDSVVNSVAIADTMDESWLAHYLNVERLSYLQTTGAGLPIYEFDLAPEDPGTVAVGSAEDASLGLLLVSSPSGVSIRGFSATGGAFPDWTYSFDANYTSASYRGVNASLDGSIVIGAASDQVAGNSVVVILDGTNGSELNRLDNLPYVGPVELSNDGRRALLTHVSNGNATVIETSGMTTLATFSGSGAGMVYHRLAGDGTVVAVGGFSCQVYKETGGAWSQIWSEANATQWYGQGLGLSDDGNTMFSVSFTYTNYLDLTYRVIDLAAGTELARTTTSGTGSLQDPMVDADASADGETFVVVSWGTQNNVHAEVQMFDRDLNLIGSIDTPGSMFDVDITRDGRYVLAGGKAVHANDFGRGSDTYAYELPTTAVPTDSHPPSDSIDARQPSDLACTALFGWDSIDVIYDGDTAGVQASDFTVTVDPADVTPPAIVNVVPSGNTATLEFDTRILLGHWTIITHNASGYSTRIGALPADVNGDKTSGPVDILDLIDFLNGVAPGLEIWQTDIDRSGVPNPADILGVIDLLNGANCLDPWNGETLPQ